MGKAKKGQASSEYMLVAAVVALSVLPAAYLFYSYSHRAAEEVDMAQLDRLGRDIVAAAGKVYFQGPLSRVELESRMPQAVANLSVTGDWNTGKQELVISASSGGVLNDFIFLSGVNLNGSFNGSLREITVSQGIKQIVVEAYETAPGPDGRPTTFVHVNFGGRCPVSVTYDFNGDGSVAGADETFARDCGSGLPGRPKFRPSKLWQPGWFANDGAMGGSLYAACMNVDYDGDCDVDDADIAIFCVQGISC